MTLAPWQTEILSQGELYLVGGAVRDRLSGARQSGYRADDDYLVRGIAPAELEAILTRHGRVSLVGKSFGVYKFTADDGKTVDLVFPRTEVSTGSGHREFDVHWDWNLPVEEDLRRRDFTINAIAEDVRDGRVVDPFDGRRDMQARKLRMIFPKAFQEDPLRIIRGVRFCARFELSIETATFGAMKGAVELLPTISAERIQAEFTRLFEQADRPSLAFRLLRHLGGLKLLLPELDRCAGVEQNEYHPDDVFEHSLKSCDAAPSGDTLVRWAALLHDVGKVDHRQIVKDERGERVVFYGHEEDSARKTRAVLERFQYSNKLVDRCVAIVENHMYNYEPEWKDATLRRFVRRVGDENLEALFLLREADCRSRDLVGELELLEELRVRIDREREAGGILKVTDLAISGGDLIRELNVAPGPGMGELLDHLLEMVTADPTLNTREKLMAIAAESLEKG